MNKIYQAPYAYYNSLFFEKSFPNMNTPPKDSSSIFLYQKNKLMEEQINYIKNVLKNQLHSYSNEISRPLSFVETCKETTQNVINFGQITVLPTFLLFLIVYEKNVGFLTKLMAIVIFIIFLTTIWGIFESQNKKKKSTLNILRDNANNILNEMDNNENFSENSSDYKILSEFYNQSAALAATRSYYSTKNEEPPIQNTPIITEVFSDDNEEVEEKTVDLKRDSYNKSTKYDEFLR